MGCVEIQGNLPSGGGDDLENIELSDSPGTTLPPNIKIVVDDADSEHYQPSAYPSSKSTRSHPNQPHFNQGSLKGSSSSGYHSESDYCDSTDNNNYYHEFEDDTENDRLQAGNNGQYRHSNHIFENEKGISTDIGNKKHYNQSDFNSPIEIVAATVSVEDYPHYATLTKKFWIISIFLILFCNIVINLYSYIYNTRNKLVKINVPKTINSLWDYTSDVDTQVLAGIKPGYGDAQSSDFSDYLSINILEGATKVTVAKTTKGLEISNNMLPRLEVSLTIVQLVVFVFSKLISFLPPINLFGRKLLDPKQLKIHYKEHLLIAIAVFASCNMAIPIRAFNTGYFMNFDLKKPTSDDTGYSKLRPTARIIELLDIKSYFGFFEFRVYSWMLLCIAMQYLGYSFAGALISLAVKPSVMVYPENLVSVTLLNLLYKANQPSLRKRQVLVCLCVSIGICVYSLIPHLLAPILTSLAVLCYFDPGLQESTLSMLGSSTGLGIGSISLDYRMISRLEPLVTPFWATVNLCAGGLILTHIIMPILYHNGKAGVDTPIASKNSYYESDKSNPIYPIDLLINKEVITQHTQNMTFEGLKVSTFYHIAMFCAVAATGALISHMMLYYYGFIKRNLLKPKRPRQNPKRFRPEFDDIHMFMMRRYKEPPRMMFAILFTMSILVIVFVTTEIGVWSLGIFAGICFAFIIAAFSSMAVAISNVIIVPSAFLFGIFAYSSIDQKYNSFDNQPTSRLVPTPITVLELEIVSSILKSAIISCISMLSNLKLGVYLKVPMLHIVFAQAFGTAFGTVINVFAKLIINKSAISSSTEHLKRINNNADLAHSSTYYLNNKSSIIMEISGSAARYLKFQIFTGFKTKIFGKFGIPTIILYFLLGLVAPVPLFLLYNKATRSERSTKPNSKLKINKTIKSDASDNQNKSDLENPNLQVIPKVYCNTQVYRFKPPSCKLSNNVYGCVFYNLLTKPFLLVVYSIICIPIFTISSKSVPPNMDAAQLCDFIFA
ncbi:hypothetical protein BB560_003700 [Smittium megazygosporum]|uniref:Uncharacterized protein n=1 Tax=Smittium megazygosporum TaxID=133381 RepID=A0A2T9ZB83_9FUNG|nr:hypothetical protein BB560_003700 [Smittium megazygosporum]